MNLEQYFKRVAGFSADKIINTEDIKRKLVGDLIGSGDVDLANILCSYDSKRGPAEEIMESLSLWGLNEHHEFRPPILFLMSTVACYYVGEGFLQPQQKLRPAEDGISLASIYGLKNKDKRLTMILYNEKTDEATIVTKNLNIQQTEVPTRLRRK